MPEATAEADGFKALGLRLHTASPFITYVYLKQHRSSASSDGDAGAVPHAVFVAGLPLGVDEAQLLEVFSCFGVVSKVVLHATKVWLPALAAVRCPGRPSISMAVLLPHCRVSTEGSTAWRLF